MKTFRRKTMKTFSVLMALLFISLSLTAQKLTVGSMRLLPDDPSARLFENQREDNNGTVAGIVKVIIASDGVEFESDKILDRRKWGMGEYWVWLAQGCTKLIVRAPGYSPLEVNFSDYDLVVRPKLTYRLVITLPSGSQQSQQEVLAEVSSDNHVQTFKVKGVSFRMVQVDGGTFQMGATSEQGRSLVYNHEKPVHNVTLASYMIGETEVTQELWEAVMGTTIRQQRDKFEKVAPILGKGKNYPMYYVTWDECREFISRLNSLTGQRFRLPTEAEWEFAARGGNKSHKTRYGGGNTLSDVAWYWQNSGDKVLDGEDSDWNAAKVKDNNCRAHPVATKQKNELGLYDMSGNVCEWCQDWYEETYYSHSSPNNPTGPSKGSKRVNRGGSWFSYATLCRLSYRAAEVPGYRDFGTGFRLAL